MTSSLINYSNKATTFFSPQENCGRIGKLLTSFMFLLYETTFELEPSAPLHFSTVVIKGGFLGIVLITAL